MANFKLGYTMSPQPTSTLPNAAQQVVSARQSGSIFDEAGKIAGNLGAGVIKSAIGTVKGLGDIGVAGVNALSDVPGLGYLKVPDNFAPSKKLGEVATPSNVAQTVGKTAGDIAQFFVPGGAEKAAAGKISEAIDTAKFAEKFGPEAGNALSSILKAAGKTAVMAGSAAGVTAAETGGNLKATAGGAAAGALGVPVGKVLESVGAGVAKMFIPKSDAEAGMLQAYKAATPFVDRMKAILGVGSKKAPSTAASAAFEKGIAGTESFMGVSAKRTQNKLWTKLINPALEQSDVKIDIPSFIQEAETTITQETNDPTRLGVLKNAIDAIKEDFANIGEISLAQLQKYKEGWAEFVPEKAYKGQPIAGALNDVRNTLASLARTKIYSALGGNVKQAYLDYGNLHGITALGRKAMTGAIKGGTGTTLKNLLEMATIPIGTLGGQTIYKVGQGVELFGRAGATVVRDVLGIGAGQDQTSHSPTKPTN